MGRGVPGEQTVQLAVHPQHLAPDAGVVGVAASGVVPIGGIRVDQGVAPVAQNPAAIGGVGTCNISKRNTSGITVQIVADIQHTGGHLTHQAADGSGAGAA